MNIRANVRHSGQMLKLAVWSAVEPGLGITATSLATLRPLAQTVTHTLKTRRGSKKNTNSNPRSSGTLSVENKSRPRPEGRGFSVLNEGFNVTMKTVDTTFDGSKDSIHIASNSEPSDEERSLSKVTWWRLPKQSTGLMTEFRRATRDIRLEEPTLKEKLDLEAGPDGGG